MPLLVLKNLIRRPIRTGLSLAGLAVACAMMTVLLSFTRAYELSLHAELDRMGIQMMLVPLGCPYDAAARVLKGRALDVSLPASDLDIARRDKAVAVAAPICSAAIPRPDQGRTDLWVGIDPSMRALKPWWRLTEGSTWPASPDDVLLGAEAAETELRKPGDHLFSPETGRRFRVCGLLERTGTSDDSQFFVTLPTAQAMFHQAGRLTAVAIRLTDPTLVADASERLQQAPGAQVVTLAEMMGTFLTLLGATRTLLLAILIVAGAISLLSVFNTMTAAVLERTSELGVLRAVGMSRAGVFGLMLSEAMGLAFIGGVAGLILAILGGGLVLALIRPFVPLAPSWNFVAPSGAAVALCLGGASLAGALAGLPPAWQASRLSPAVALRME